MEKMPPARQPTNCEPSGAGRSWEGGTRERADDVFFASDKKDVGAKRTLLRRGARGGSRTRTPLRALAPVASESTNSTTRASCKFICASQREIYITM